MKINERLVTRQFLNNIISEDASIEDVHSLGIDSCFDSDADHSSEHSSNSPLEVDQYGIVTKDSLYRHFDLDQDGKVTPQEYADHIKFHCQYPETLDHYNSLRQQAHQSVPCQSSYDMCSQHFMSEPDSIKDILSPMLTMTGVDCHESAISGLIDVIRCLKEKGLF